VSAFAPVRRRCFPRSFHLRGRRASRRIASKSSVVFASAVEFKQELERGFAWQVQAAVAVRGRDSVDRSGGSGSRGTQARVHESGGDEGVVALRREVPEWVGCVQEQLPVRKREGSPLCERATTLRIVARAENARGGRQRPDLRNPLGEHSPENEQRRYAEDHQPQNVSEVVDRVLTALTEILHRIADERDGLADFLDAATEDGDLVHGVVNLQSEPGEQDQEEEKEGVAQDRRQAPGWQLGIEAHGTRVPPLDESSQFGHLAAEAVPFDLERPAGDADDFFNIGRSAAGLYATAAQSRKNPSPSSLDNSL